MKSESESRSVVSDSLISHGLYSPWNSPGQNTGVGSLSLLQGFFPTQGSNPGPPHCRESLYQMSCKGSPRILDWIAYPFSRGSSWARNQSRVSCIAGGFFTNWAIRETLKGDIMRHRFDLWVWKILWTGHGNPLQYSCLENQRTEPSKLQFIESKGVK